MKIARFSKSQHFNELSLEGRHNKIAHNCILAWQIINFCPLRENTIHSTGFFIFVKQIQLVFLPKWQDKNPSISKKTNNQKVRCCDFYLINFLSNGTKNRDQDRPIYLTMEYDDLLRDSSDLFSMDRLTFSVQDEALVMMALPKWHWKIVARGPR